MQRVYSKSEGSRIVGFLVCSGNSKTFSVRGLKYRHGSVWYRPRFMREAEAMSCRAL